MRYVESVRYLDIPCYYHLSSFFPLTPSVFVMTGFVSSVDWLLHIVLAHFVIFNVKWETVEKEYCTQAFSFSYINRRLRFSSASEYFFHINKCCFVIIYSLLWSNEEQIFPQGLFLACDAGLCGFRRNMCRPTLKTQYYWND